jgi:hypothetical protein
MVNDLLLSLGATTTNPTLDTETGVMGFDDGSGGPIIRSINGIESGVVTLEMDQKVKILGENFSQNGQIITPIGNFPFRRTYESIEDEKIGKNEKYNKDKDPEKDKYNYKRRRITELEFTPITSELFKSSDGQKYGKILEGFIIVRNSYKKESDKKEAGRKVKFKY